VSSCLPRLLRMVTPTTSSRRRVASSTGFGEHMEHLSPSACQGSGAWGLCRYAGLVRDLAARRASEQQAQLATAAERATSATAALRQVPSLQQHLVIP
jgi:hypothetical protein